MKSLVAGASGLVGSALIPALESDSAEINRLVRSSPKANEIEWHPNQGGIDATRLEGFDAIITLAGEHSGEGVGPREKERTFCDSPLDGPQPFTEASQQL